MQKTAIGNSISDFLRGKRVVLLWSGGFESTYLLKLFVEKKIYEICDLDVLSIAFPDDVYCRERLDRAEEYLTSLGIRTRIIHPSDVIDKDRVAYSDACLLCKDIRRKYINGFIRERGEELVFVTGHNLDDLISYLLENIVTMTAGNFEMKEARYLETSNKFIDKFDYDGRYFIYRPLLAYSKRALTADGFSELDGIFSVTERECYWGNQRKRIFQTYLSQTNADFDLGRTADIFKRLVGMPSEDAFRRLPFETYLL